MVGGGGGAGGSVGASVGLTTEERELKLPHQTTFEMW